jgi:protein NRD1
MESFDFSTFDLTSPTSWEALGKMWEVTYGCPPRGDQLMQFVMSLSLGAMGMAPPSGDSMVATSGQGQWGGVGGAQDSGKQSWGMDGRGTGHATRGRGRGRGGGFHGNGRDNQRAYNGFSSNQDTDAIVLGGGDDAEVQEPMVVDATTAPVAENTGGGGLGGKMQKVGDKWVFVRNV